MNFVKGFISTGKTLRMILLLFVINLVFSMILAVPMYNSLKNSFGNSLVSERMGEGFDYLWWEEFRDSAEGLEKTFSPSIIGKGAVLNNLEGLVHFRFFNLPPALLFLGLLYIILHTFLAGGILSVFKDEPPKFSMKGFFKGAGTLFPRFFLLMLISSVLFTSIAVFLSGGFSSILKNIRENAVSEVFPFYIALAFSAIVLFLILFIQMVFDYGRIKIALEDSSSIIKSALEAFAFVFRHPGSTLGLYYLILLSHVVVTLIYILLIELVAQSTFLGVIVAFLLQQVFIFSIIWIRCWFYSSQIELYRYLK